MATTLPEFIPAARASWKVNDLAIANHEAQHAVAAVLFGLDILEARIDRPDDAGGRVSCARNVERWRNAAAYIAPVAMEGRAPGTLDPLATDHDTFAATCGFIESGRPASEWGVFVESVVDALLTPAPKRAILLVASALLEHGAHGRRRSTARRRSRGRVQGELRRSSTGGLQDRVTSTSQRGPAGPTKGGPLINSLPRHPSCDHPLITVATARSDAYRAPMPWWSSCRSALHRLAPRQPTDRQIGMCLVSPTGADDLDLVGRHRPQGDFNP